MASKNPLDSQQALVLDVALLVLQETDGRWTGQEILEFVYLLEETGGKVFRPKSPGPDLEIVYGHKDVGSED